MFDFEERTKVRMTRRERMLGIVAAVLVNLVLIVILVLTQISQHHVWGYGHIRSGLTMVGHGDPHAPEYPMMSCEYHIRTLGINDDTSHSATHWLRLNPAASARKTFLGWCPDSLPIYLESRFDAGLRGVPSPLAIATTRRGKVVERELYDPDDTLHPRSTDYMMLAQSERWNLPIPEDTVSRPPVVLYRIVVVYDE